jgi:hypothetical protein
MLTIERENSPEKQYHHGICYWVAALQGELKSGKKSVVRTFERINVQDPRAKSLIVSGSNI